jgi:superfamily II DNA/RNA helicase
LLQTKPVVSPYTSLPAFIPLTTFDALPLAEPLLRGLTACGFSTPTEIQARALPVALEGRDVLASAQTGTGKTAAFALPALNRLLAKPRTAGRGPRVLVLTPTRELAIQVEGVIRELGRFAHVRTGVVMGGVSSQPQERLLRGTLDILVATPGRLLDHMGQGLLDFSSLELLVLDEADRMLDMGFIKPVKRIAAALPARRQTMMFSATLEGGIGEIAKVLLRDPVRIQIASAKVRHAAIEQRLHPVDSPEHKHALLSHLLRDSALTQAIVFTGTKRGADRLAKRLTQGGLACAALHGDMRQSARQRTVDSLRSGRLRILVATDVAARGIDIIGVSHVINFDLPMVAEDYIHRIGRTGRNGATGIAISLVGHQDGEKLRNIERLTGHRLDRQEIKGLRIPQSPRPIPPQPGAAARPHLRAPSATGAARPHGAAQAGNPPAVRAASAGGWSRAAEGPGRGARHRRGR